MRDKREHGSSNAIRDLKSRPTYAKDYLRVGKVQEPVSPISYSSRERVKLYKRRETDESKETPFIPRKTSINQNKNKIFKILFRI